MININMSVDCTCYNNEIQKEIQRMLIRQLNGLVKHAICQIRLPNGRYVHPDDILITGNITNDNKRLFV